MKRRIEITRNVMPATALVLGLIFIHSFSGRASAQPADFFETARLESRLKADLRLTATDIKILRPLIWKENNELISALAHCMSERDEDYLSIWISLRSENENFQTVRLRGLSSRQKMALRAAHAEFEARVVEHWQDAYIAVLAEVLELDWIQTDLVGKIFDADRKKRLELLTATTTPSTDAAWKTLGDLLEARLSMVLAPEQMEQYRSMARRDQRLFAAVLQSIGRSGG